MAEGAQINNHAGLIWPIADLLRGDYKRAEYGKVILPLTVLRRLDCVLEPTKEQVLARAKTRGRSRTSTPSSTAITGVEAYNTSPLDAASHPGRPAPGRRQPARLDRGLLPRDPRRHREVRLRCPDRPPRARQAAVPGRLQGDRGRPAPDRVSNLEMGYLYEELIRRFSELSNEKAGEHFTPREVIRLMVDLLFIEDDEAAAHPGHRCAPCSTPPAARAACSR